MLVGFLIEALWPILVSIVFQLIIAVGVSLLVYAVRQKKSEEDYTSPDPKFPTLLFIFSSIFSFVLIFGLWALFSSYTTVDAGNIVAVRRFGRLQTSLSEGGPYWVMPFVDKRIDVVVLNRSYETSENPDSSDANFTDYQIDANTNDGQQIKVRYTVLFKMPNNDAVLDVLRTTGNIDLVKENVVKVSSRNIVRLIAQGFSAEELYSGDTVFLFQDKVVNGGVIEVGDKEIVVTGLKESIENSGAEFLSFAIRKIAFDQDYVDAIERQQIEQENIETSKFAAEAAEWDKQRSIRESEAKKQEEVLLAEASAQKIILQAQAEADAIKLRGEALELYPQVLELNMVDNLRNTKWILPFDSVEPFVPLDILETE